MLQQWSERWKIMDNMAYTLFSLSSISRLALWSLILVSGIWIHRKFKLNSLPWLGAYLVLSVTLSFVTSVIPIPIAESTAAQRSPPGWHPAQFFAIWGYWDRFITDLTQLMLGILILSDILFLLSKAGIKVEGTFWNTFLAVRERSTILGIAMIIIMVSGPAISLLL